MSLNVKEVPWTRRVVGWISQKLFPWYSNCYRCGRTWNLCNSHSTWHKHYPDGSASGVGMLCETCWRELTPQKRLVFYREWWVQHRKYKDPEQAEWFLIERAVMEEED